MTTSFYVPPTSFRDNYVRLPQEEAHHATRVLRKRAGDEIVVVDGEGGWHRVRLDQVDDQYVGGTVVDTRRDVGEPRYRLRIGLALLKNRNRYETFLEKAVELGVAEVVPLLTERTQKQRLRRKRAENILVAAMKQSGRSRLVQLHVPQALDDVLGGAEEDELRCICHEAEEATNLLDLVQGSAASIRVLVGPEGGFTEDEVARAREAGYRVVGLGPRRLRAETAALAVAAGVSLVRT